MPLPVRTSGSHVVWLDQVMPMYRSAAFVQEAVIGVQRSTNHRFRCVVVFQRTNRDDERLYPAGRDLATDHPGHPMRALRCCAVSLRTMRRPRWPERNMGTGPDEPRSGLAAGGAGWARLPPPSPLDRLDVQSFGTAVVGVAPCRRLWFVGHQIHVARADFDDLPALALEPPAPWPCLVSDGRRRPSMKTSSRRSTLACQPGWSCR